MGSGYGRQVYNLCKYMNTQSDIDWAVLSHKSDAVVPYNNGLPVIASKAIDIEKMSRPNDLGDFLVYPAKRCNTCWDILRETIEHYNPDVVLYFRDFWGLQQTPNFEQDAHNLPDNLVAWLPVDHQPLAQRAYSEYIEQIPNIVGLCKQGAQEYTTKGKDDVPFIYHSILASPKLTELPFEINWIDIKSEAKKSLGFPATCHLVSLVLTNNSFPSRKAIDINLIGAANFANQHPDVKLFIHCRKGAKDIGIDIVSLLPMLKIDNSQISTAGAKGLTDEAMDKVMAATDTLVFCSAGEGFGVPIIEAQYWGSAVVTTDCTSMAELTFNGVCIPVNQSMHQASSGSFWHYPCDTDITTALNLLYKRTDLQRQVNSAFGNKVVRENFECNIIGKQWCEYFRNFVEQRRKCFDPVEIAAKMASMVNPPENIQTPEVMKHRDEFMRSYKLQATPSPSFADHLLKYFIDYFKESLSVLDIGCHTAGQWVPLYDSFLPNTRYYGVDIVPMYVMRAPHTLLPLRSNPRYDMANISLTYADAYTFIPECPTMDIILMLDLLAFVKEPPIIIIESIKKLTPSGRIIIVNNVTTSLSRGAFHTLPHNEFSANIISMLESIPVKTHFEFHTTFTINLEEYALYSISHTKYKESVGKSGLGGHLDSIIDDVLSGCS